jgi:NAD(P)-dependent dehydrogenase (short-subunit alcohol dehydrogenase family)
MRILITGGASGLGAAITERLAAHSNWHVDFTYHGSKDAAELLSRRFANATAIHCDFADPDSRRALTSRIESCDLDVLIHNATTGLAVERFRKLAPADFHAGFVTDVIPVIELTQAALKVFRKRKAGKIVTILSSFILNRPPLGLSEYVARKAYLRSLAKSWAVEHHYVTSVCISPSMMRTRLLAEQDERLLETLESQHPLKKFITPETVAETVEFVVTGSPHLNGANIVLNAGADLV